MVGHEFFPRIKKKKKIIDDIGMIKLIGWK